MWSALRRPSVLASLATTALVAACGSASPAPSSVPFPSPGSSPAAPPSSIAPSAAASNASPNAIASIDTGGFAFAADDVVAYYASQGYACSASAPSATAVGFAVRTCEKVDDAGRTRTIGVVTDPGGVLSDAFAGVRGTFDEAFLAPTDALDPLAGFLGATLG